MSLGVADLPVGKSTMEGAVRSGYLAAQAVTRAAENPMGFLQPDLAATGFMRLLPK